MEQNKKKKSVKLREQSAFRPADRAEDPSEEKAMIPVNEINWCQEREPTDFP